MGEIVIRPIHEMENKEVIELMQKLLDIGYTTKKLGKSLNVEIEEVSYEEVYGGVNYYDVH
jgi:hypothetical protein